VTRIVTTHYRYKRPPLKRKDGAVRRPGGRDAEAEVCGLRQSGSVTVESDPERIVRMPDTWNIAIYRARAAAWRDKATSLPEDSRERSVCQTIAEGYDDLADLIEEREHLSRPPKAP
jgi:hypothetical protein